MAYEYIEEFRNLGFGLFVHFGLYSMLGKGEWIFKLGNVDRNEYVALRDKFDVDKDWARKLVGTAKSSGCRYITLTARHHDGFSLYDTRGLSDFDAPRSPLKRDLVKEFVEACEQGGVIPFFYHTLLDWTNPYYKSDFKKYIDYLDESIEILCTRYGKIGGFWFDGMWDKPHADWQQDRLYATIRKHQPDAMIINNTGLKATGKLGHKEIDSVTFERGKPFPIKNASRPIAGEVCDGLNDHWGYAEYDIRFKTPKELIEALIGSRACGCNYLLNVGLKGDGTIGEIEKGILLSVGKWIEKNDGFIYRARPSDLEADNAVVLTDGERYYAVVDDVPMTADSDVALSGRRKRVRVKTKKSLTACRWLDDGKGFSAFLGSFNVRKFEYGTSLCSRVAVFKLR